MMVLIKTEKLTRESSHCIRIGKDNVNKKIMNIP
jgi:hypothetical protein